MRILIVAMSDSIHTVRWIAQISDQVWDIHLFPSKDLGYIHPDMKNITVHHSVYHIRRNKCSDVKFYGVPTFSDHVARYARKFLEEFFPNYRAIQLKWLIKRIKPDIIHSLEIQHAGYLTLEAKKISKNKFFPWIVTNWGSDIYLFGRLSEHAPKIREVLSKCDYYSCECHRDVSLARSFGFKGEVLPVFPNTGGFYLEEILKLRQPGHISERRIIMLKGYQGWAGRVLVGLRALERCAEQLQGYRIVIYSGGCPEVKIAAELLTKSTGISIKSIPLETAHKEILKLHGQARISIAINISDAISISFLEALVMGSFPIQTYTGCANEWIEDGKTGLLVPPEDPDVIEKAIRRALTDDNLVDQAAEENWKTAVKRLDQSLLKPKAIEMYQKIFEKHYKPVKRNKIND